MIRASAPYTSGWGSFVLLKMDRVRVVQGGSLSMLHWSNCANSQVLIEGYLTSLLLVQLTQMELDDLSKINRA